MSICVKNLAILTLSTYFTCYQEVRCDNTLILKPLERLLNKKRMNTSVPLVLHNEQGSQYTSISFTSLLERYNITQSMSIVGNSRDNAVMESFFGWFKYILEHDFKYKSPVQYRIERCYV